MGGQIAIAPHNVPAELRRGVLIAGAGVSGRGAARILAALGVAFSVADDNEDNLAAVARETQAPTMSTAEAERALSRFSVVVTSPGWRPDTPLLRAAAEAGLDVYGDVELCFRLDRAGVFGAPRTWLAVTGTNGKTTTTGMLAAIMAESARDTGLNAVACGNIGLSVGDALLANKRADVLVAELSSFQLHWSRELRPTAGVLLNLAADHIDWHGSFAAYAHDKARLLQAETAVAGIDDPEVARLVRESGRGDVIGFTLAEPGENQVGIKGETIVARRGGGEVELASAVGIEPAGAAGVYDALAAAAVAYSQGVHPERIRTGLAGYRVAGHRGAVVHSAGGVDWVDNSKATNPHAADSALAGAGTVVWIAGGQLKGAEVDDLVRAHAHQFRAVGLIGADREILREALQRLAPSVPVWVTDEADPARAMDAVVDFAAAQARPGDTVLLAPAAASLDMFSGMSQRGEYFAAAAMRHS